jgi:hypothetical protein
MRIKTGGGRGVRNHMGGMVRLESTLGAAEVEGEESVTKEGKSGFRKVGT